MTTYHGPVGAAIVNVRCDACGAVFGVHFESRRQARRTVQLWGALMQVGTTHVLAPITVTSLSLGGIGFRLHTPASIQPGEFYDVLFRLDDAAHTLLGYTIMLRRMQGLEGGAELCRSGTTMDALDYYLIDAVAPHESTDDVARGPEALPSAPARCLEPPAA
jgi:hypothetical protein